MGQIVKGFDEEVEAMLEAEGVRMSLTPYSSGHIYFEQGPWVMKEDPWRVEWESQHSGKLCAICLIQIPTKGKKYIMFTTYADDNSVRCYVFLRSQYHSKGEPE